MNKQMAILAMSLSMAAFASPRPGGEGACDRRGPYLESRAVREHRERERYDRECERIHRAEVRMRERREGERREPVRVVEVVRETPRVVVVPRVRIDIHWP